MLSILRNIPFVAAASVATLLGIVSVIHLLEIKSLEKRLERVQARLESCEKDKLITQLDRDRLKNKLTRVMEEAKAREKELKTLMEDSETAARELLAARNRREELLKRKLEEARKTKATTPEERLDRCEKARALLVQ